MKELTAVARYWLSCEKAMWVMASWVKRRGCWATSSREMASTSRMVPEPKPTAEETEVIITSRHPTEPILDIHLEAFKSNFHHRLLCRAIPNYCQYK